MAGLDRITDITVFVRIAGAGSLSAAARDLDLSLAAVSKRLIRLEQALNCRLVDRTTRRLGLTAEGRVFHTHCLGVLESVRRAEEAIADQRRDVSGLIRVTATNAFARRQIAPRLGAFLDRHPGIRFDLIATDDAVDLVKDGVDIAVRQWAELPNSDLVSRVIASDRRVPCAAPRYLDVHRAPETPEDLKRHRCIVFGDPPITNWTFFGAEETRSVEVDWVTHFNSGDVAHTAALGGAGIVAKSIWEVAADIASGELVEILTKWRMPARPIHVVYPSIRHKAPRIAAFIAFLAAELRAAEGELGIG